MSDLSRHSRAMLLNVLWHHQGGSSEVGQAIRTMLGIGEHERMTDAQVDEAKWIDGLLAHAASDSRVPEGCAIVPKEPTHAMVAAAAKDHEGEYYLPASLWRSMLAAAPAPAAAPRSEPTGWQPIETAPRDSSRVIVACKSEHTHEWHVVEAWWAMPYEDAPAERCEWRYDGTHCMLDKSIHGIGASHWQPKPSHPEASPTPPAVASGEPTAEQWRTLVDELATDLENEIENRRAGEVPRRIERDLEIVREARRMLARRAAAKGEG